MLENGHINRQGKKPEKFGKRSPAVEQPGPHGVAGLAFYCGEGISYSLRLLRKELEHQHRDLITEKRFAASLKTEPNGKWQDVTGAVTPQALVKAVKFHDRHSSVVLSLAENASVSRRISTDPFTLFAGHFNEVMMERGWHLRMTTTERARREFAELIEMIQVLPGGCDAFLERRL